MCDKPSPIFKAIGASSHTPDERQRHDYYATNPKAVEILLENECFSHYVWECACGEGHISKVFEQHGYNVRSTDLIYRGYGRGGVDFLKTTEADVESSVPRDIVTNPPFKCANEFVEHALDISPAGTKVAMLLKLIFLEGQARKKLFEKYPPKRIYVFSGRISCAKNGNFEGVGASAVCYAWFIWEKSFKGDPIIKWVN